MSMPGRSRRYILTHGLCSNVIVFTMMFSISAFAEIKSVTGYGSGDNQREAIIVALGDAVSNAGAKMQANTEVNKGRLVADNGEYKGEGFLLSYEIIENGEAFDGPYVRVKARISDDPDFELKDGMHAVEGIGFGKTVQEAENIAVANTIIASGAKVRISGRYQNDELTEDLEEYVASGVIGHYVVVDQSERNGCAEVKVVSPVCKTIGDLIAEGTNVSIHVTGQGGARLIALKRCNAILDTASEYDVKTKYASGKLKNIEVTRKCHVYFVQRNVSSIDINPVKVRQQGRVRAVGCGSGDTILEAIRAAECNAILWFGADADVECKYVNGCKISMVGKFKGGCSVRTFDVLEMKKGVNGYEAKVSAELTASPTSNVQCPTEVVVEGYGATKDAALEDAKKNALNNVFGRNVKVALMEKNGSVISSSMCGEYCGEGFVSEFDELSSRTECGANIVQIKAVVRTEPEEESFLWKAIKFIWNLIVGILLFIIMVIWWILKAIWAIICWFFGLFF